MAVAPVVGDDEKQVRAAAGLGDERSGGSGEQVTAGKSGIHGGWGKLIALLAPSGGAARTPGRNAASRLVVLPLGSTGSPSAPGGGGRCRGNIGAEMLPKTRTDCAHRMSPAMIRAAALLVALTILSPATRAQPAAPSRATGAALSPERVKRIDRLLQQYADQNRIPGAVALVLRDGKPVYRARLRLERQGSRAAHDDGHHLPHRLADQGDDQRRRPRAGGGRPDRARTSPPGASSRPSRRPRWR